MTRGVDISMLRDPARMGRAGELVVLVHMLAYGIKGLRATDAQELPKFSLEYGGTDLGSHLEKPVGHSFKICLVKPDADQPRWSEAHLRELLMAYGRFVCTQAVCRRWNLLSRALSHFGEFTAPEWTEARLRRRVSSSDYERYARIRRGLMSFQNFLAALFMLSAMKNLTRDYGKTLQDGGLSYFREAVRWILSEETGVPLLAFRLMQNLSEEEALRGRVYSAPRDELEKLMCEVTRFRRSYPVSADAVREMRCTQVMGVDLGDEVAFQCVAAGDIYRVFDEECVGLGSLLVGERDMHDFLSIVQLQGSL